MEDFTSLAMQPTEKNQVILILPSTSDPIQMVKFIREVPAVLTGQISKTTGYWKETLITLELQTSIHVADVASKLAKMPAVEMVQENQSSRSQATECSQIVVNLRKSSLVDDQETNVPLRQIETAQ